jgi:hypothetical protein
VQFVPSGNAQTIRGGKTEVLQNDNVKQEALNVARVSGKQLLSDDNQQMKERLIV